MDIDLKYYVSEIQITKKLQLLATKSPCTKSILVSSITRLVLPNIGFTAL